MFHQFENRHRHEYSAAPPRTFQHIVAAWLSIGWLLRAALIFGILVTVGLLAGYCSTRLRSTVGDSGTAIPPIRLAKQGLTVPRVVSCRDAPFQIKPHLLLRDVVTDEELVTVLCGAVPLWNPPTVPSLIHEAKLWKEHAEFTSEMTGRAIAGRDIIATLLSDDLCRARTSQNGGSYLLDSPYGIRVVELGSSDAEANRGEAHFGQLLMYLAEADVPSTIQVCSSSGRKGTLADIFQDMVMRFSFSREIEFSGCAIVYWLPFGQRRWTNEFAESFSFDQLMAQLLAKPLGQGACGGCHVPYTVVAILRRDDEDPILTSEVRKKAVAWLKQLSHQLEIRQTSLGGWDRTWTDERIGYLYGQDSLDRILITGHHLEWMAIAPPDCLPRRETIELAVEALRNDVAEVTKVPRRSFKTIFPVTHAARALTLFRGIDAFSFFQEAWNTHRVTQIK